MATRYVSTFAQITPAITASANGDSIVFQAPITLTAGLTITANKSITFVSDSGGPYTLTRGTAYAGVLITINASAELTLTSITIDGGSRTGVSQLISNSGQLILALSATLQNNFSNTTGGAIYNTGSGSETTINSGRIFNNRGTSGGAIYNVVACGLTITGGVITGNTATTTTAGNGGGAVFNLGSMNMTGGTIQNNTAQLGGGIYQGYNTTASTHLMISGGIVRFNMATANGGGIYIAGNSATTPPVSIQGNTSILGNIAGTNGGGIGWENVNNLDRLRVEHYVTFANNSAQNGYIMTAAADIARHADHIQATAFTQPFIYAYNNMDIQYTSGTLVTPYTVTFTSPHHSYTYRVASGGYVDDPYRPDTICGHYAVNWYTDPAFTNLYNYDQPITGNLQLYGNEEYIPCFYKATFESDGGTPAATQQIAENQLVVQPPDPKRDCDIFLGWYTAPAGQTGTLYNFSTPMTQNTKLYARWTQQVCPPEKNVTFDSWGGSPVAAQTVYQGTAAAEPEPPTRWCDVFLGWYTSRDATEPWSFSAPVTNDMTLTAKWEHRNCLMGMPVENKPLKATLAAVAASTAQCSAAMASLMSAEGQKITAATQATDPASGKIKPYYQQNPAAALTDLTAVNESANELLASMRKLDQILNAKRQLALELLPFVERFECVELCECTPETYQ
ncbi:hypothetical protein AGMMS49992_17610 [Clostridia bacterium]|nr:hypothetical protein AGMMS49992_17610 [Clostridia bacterium]